MIMHINSFKPKIALFLGIQQVLRALLKSEITNLPKAVYHLRYLHFLQTMVIYESFNG